jgi:16S rRNA G966 N2-methylase RsmD
MSTEYHVRHNWKRHNGVPHLHPIDNWEYSGGEEARQKRMQEVGIDKLLHEEKHRNYLMGGTWKLEPAEIEKIELDEVAYFSLCPKTHADKITQGIVDLLKSHNLNPKQMTITDGCAGVGGVSMSLIVSNMFKKVISVEMDQGRAKLLTTNIHAIKRPDNSTEIEIQQNNYLDAMPTLEQDVVFFDPPFGGPGYKYYKNAVLFLGGKHMADIANELLTKSKTKYVLIRTPENFCENYFKSNLDKHLHCYQYLELDTTNVFLVEKKP